MEQLDPIEPTQSAEQIADPKDQMRLLEALLFSSREPLRVEDLAQALPEGADVESLLAQLSADYSTRGIVLENNGALWAFRTASDLSERLTIEREEIKKLSRAGLETLAIIAYHQPVTRAEIEDIRGVAVAKGTIDTLLELDWIKPRGRKRAPGRPLMWGTSETFLDHFGLGELEDLPGVSELKSSGLLDRAPSLASDDEDQDDENDQHDEADEIDDVEEIGDEEELSLDQDVSVTGDEPDLDENIDDEAEDIPAKDNVVELSNHSKAES